MDTLVYKIMAKNNFVNLFSLFYDTIYGMKKKDLVDHIENLKGKVIVGNDIQGLFDQISNLSENVDRLVTAKKMLNRELLSVRNVNQNLQNRIVNLEKQQFKLEQYNRRNNVEIFGISNEVSDHRLPLGRNATNTTKRVIVNLINRKHTEAIPHHKKYINKKSKVFVSHSFCPYYRLLWEKQK